MQHFLFSSAALLNAIRISVENLEDRQRLQFGRKLLRHVQRGSQGHHGMEPNVIFASKSPRIGQRGGRDQPPQLRARTQSLHQRRQQAVDRSLLHQAHQRFQWPKRKSGLIAQSGSQSKFTGQFISDRGDQHASTHFDQKFPTRARRVHKSPFKRIC